MAKIITVSIDEQTGDFSIDLTGFHGKGCADVMKAFDGLGKTTKTVKKTEYNESTTNTVTK